MKCCGIEDAKDADSGSQSVWALPDRRGGEQLGCEEGYIERVREKGEKGRSGAK